MCIRDRNKGLHDDDLGIDLAGKPKVREFEPEAYKKLDNVLSYVKDGPGAARVDLRNKIEDWSYPRNDTSFANPTNLNTGLSCLLYTSPSPRDQRGTRMPSSA
eukprot:TRINITY_DN8177_c0_g1_i1.p2 TRINITY_DN8177_c0_g1~~TRINITY_DN8177_c0_g1_i1.p2  ORF type:complete len:118 (+),score=59.92 TRINITY_DN8177_c0_g1_i1:47-355(+)